MSEEVKPVETIETEPVEKTYTQDDIDKLKGALDKERELRKNAGEPFKERYVKAEAKARLGTNAERLLKLVDLSEVEVDDDFNLKGLDEAIEAAKEDFPELFDPKRQASSIDAGDKRETKRNLTASEKQAAALLGRRV